MDVQNKLPVIIGIVFAPNALIIKTGLSLVPYFQDGQGNDLHLIPPGRYPEYPPILPILIQTKDILATPSINRLFPFPQVFSRDKPKFSLKEKNQPFRQFADFGVFMLAHAL